MDQSPAATAQQLAFKKRMLTLAAMTCRLVSIYITIINPKLTSLLHSPLGDVYVLKVAVIVLSYQCIRYQTLLLSFNQSHLM